MPYNEISQSSIEDSKFKLDWNEGFADVSDFMQKIWESEAVNLNLYPDLRTTKLKEAAATFYEVDPSNIETFNGSDAAIATVCAAYLDQSKTYCIVTPTYGNYASLASRYTNKLVCFDADPLSEFDVQAFRHSLQQRKSIWFFWQTQIIQPAGI